MNSGIVRRVDPFVAEDAADLVHALEAADDQPLEVEFGRDAQRHLDVERVDVRDEGPRGGAAGDVEQRRRFALVETLRVDEAAHRRDDLAALHEHVAHVRVDDQVDVALAVALLDVDQAVPLVGQRREAFAQHLERLHVQREVAHLGAEDESPRTEEVAAVERLEQRERIAQLFLREVQLEAAGAVGDVGKRAAQRHHAAGELPRLRFGVLLGTEAFVLLREIAGMRGYVVTRRCKRVHSA